MKRFQAKNRYDDRLLCGYLLALLAGLVMLYSASSIIAESRFGSHLFFLRQQFVWAILSLAVVYVICRLDLTRIAVYSAPALLLTLILLSLVYVMPARNGSHRWLMLGPFTLQPSELFKWLMVVYLAFSLSNPKRSVADLRQLLFPYVLIIAPALVLVLFEPDLGSCTVILVSALGVLFLAGGRLKHLLSAVVPLGVVASFFVFVVGYKKDRILDYFAAVVDPLQGSYQVRQAALTLGSGGLLGSGLGEGSQKLFFLPYPHTDFVFAAAGEEIGLLGLLMVLGLLFFLLARGWKIAAAQPDRFGFLLGAGMVWMLFVNIAINVGVVTALLPVTGLALPFFSYGGSSLLVSSAAIGVLLNLSQRAA